MADPDHDRLGAALRRRRKLLGLSQQQLGDLAGCGRLFVLQAEKGKATLRLDKLLALMRVLGLRFRIEPGQGLVADAGDARGRD
ncbi:MAG: helix-turn-helix domain-containing protein [Planctomycetes bacterium]|nr:helix-turn-helix domain-containing protein [Planctomycetota bacterium]